MFPILFFLLCLQYGVARAFTIIGGQVYTPGLAIIDSPQPNTPEGGHFLQVAIDVSGNGKLDLPPYESGFATGFHNITIFLSSYTTGKNLTISNGTATSNNASLGDIMQQESGGTVKHVNWAWPDCLVGNGQDTIGGSRGEYNISIRQNFRLNSTDYYTVFDLPISVTNNIESKDNRPSCNALNNDLLSSEDITTSADLITSPFTNDTGVDTSSSPDSNGLGPEKPEAGSGSSIISEASKRFAYSTAGLLFTFYSAALILA